MENENNRTGQNVDDPHSGDDTGRRARRGIGRSIRPGSAVPPTVLVADMSEGGLLLHGWRTGPSAYLTAEDSVPVRRALVAAFGADIVSSSPEQP